MTDEINDILEEYLPFFDMDSGTFLDIQNKRVSDLVRHFYYNSRNPGFKELLNEDGITEENLPSSVDGLGKLPIITKEKFGQMGYFTCSAVPRKEIFKEIHTGGSTGTPFAVKHDFIGTKELWDMFVIAFYLNNASLDMGYWVTHWAPGKTIHSGSHAAAMYLETFLPLIDEHPGTPMDTHVDNILKYNATNGVSLPNFWIALAHHIERNGHYDYASRTNMRHILGGGAPVTQSDLEFVEKTMGLDKFLLIYVSSEAGLMATQIGDGQEYHVLPSHIVRVVDEDNNDVLPGEVGRVVVTNFLHSQPFINYDTGDKARYLGASSVLGNSVSIDQITRNQTLILGGMKLDYKYLTDGLIPALQTQYQFPFNKIQFVKSSASDGKNKLIINFETPEDQSKYQELEQRLVEIVCQENFQIQYNRGLADPEYHFEAKAHSALGVVNKKLPLMVDETR